MIGILSNFGSIFGLITQQQYFVEISANIDALITCLCILSIFSEYDTLYKYTLGFFQPCIIGCLTNYCCFAKCKRIPTIPGNTSVTTATAGHTATATLTEQPQATASSPRLSSPPEQQDHQVQFSSEDKTSADTTESVKESTKDEKMLALQLDVQN